MGGAAELKALLLCDLVESTRLVERLGDARAAAVFGEHDRLARALLEQHDGREIDKTDGLLALFDRPFNAVQFAVAYQDALSRLARERGVALEARVGIHLGEVYLRENEPAAVARGAKPVEVEGLAKPIAARLMSLAQGRQILLTRAAYDVARRATVGADAATPLQWRSHGHYQLKGVSEPVEVYEVGVAGLARLLAPPDTDKARRAGAPARPGVLVLPFTDRSPGADTGYICDGLADEIITSLSCLASLRVISHSAAMQLKGTAKDSRILGAELNVQYVVHGSVQRGGDSLRITAQLVQAEVDEVVWGERTDGRLDDLFTIEETITRGIVDALKLRLSAQEERRLASRPIPDAAAYEYYLRARQLVYSFTAEALDRALEYLQKGLTVLGDNPKLQAATGYVYWQYVNAGIRPDPAYLEQARACAQRILEAEPDAPDGHRLLGLVEIHAKGDTQAVARHLKLALAADPNDTDSLFWLAIVYGFAGYPKAARPLIQRLLEIDPLSPFPHVMPGYLSLLEGDFAGAVPQLLEAHRLDPSNPIVAAAYGQGLLLAGQTEDAGAAFRRLETDAPDTFFARIGRCYLHALAGEREALAATVTGDVKDGASTDMQYAWMLAECFALAGDVPQALEWLATAIRFGNLNYPLLAERDPLLARLRDDPGAAPVLAELRAKWRAFEP